MNIPHLTENYDLKYLKKFQREALKPQHVTLYSLQVKKVRKKVDE